MQTNYSQDGTTPQMEDTQVFRLGTSANIMQKSVSDRKTLDGAVLSLVHREVLSMYQGEISRQAAWRDMMARDEAFYDNKQWTEEEEAILHDRGQMSLTYNVTATAINYLLGTFRRAPKDFRILPRKKNGQAAAELKTELMKYVRDTSNGSHQENKAFRDAVRAGVGWLENGYLADYDNEPLYESHESWRNIVWDSVSTKDNMDDARYLFRQRWTDLDAAAAKFPQSKNMLINSCSNALDTTSMTMHDIMGDKSMDAREQAYWDSGAYAYSGEQIMRRRLRLIEGWYRRTTTVEVMRGGEFTGEIFDDRSRGHVRSINEGQSEKVNAVRQLMHVAVFTEKGLLYHGPTPYRHNKFPLTPIWGNRDAETGMPYGAIRQLVDIQRDMNKRASKALHLMSSTRVYIEKGSVDDVEILRDEAARPDAIIEYRQGFMAPKLETDTSIAAGHIELMSRDAQMIQSISGITDENMGRETNATSGKAILARQQEGATTTFHYFDNARTGRISHGTKQLSLIEQYYDEEKQFRITDQRGNPAWKVINEPGTPDNDITNTKADYIVEESDWNATVRQAQSAALMELMGTLAQTTPEIVLQTLDLLVETMDVPKRDELVTRIRNITGAADPDADPDNPTPEAQAKAEAAATQAAIQSRVAELELQGLEAKVALEKAKSEETSAKAKKVSAEITSAAISDMNAAIKAAMDVAGAPAVAAAADFIMIEAKAEAQANTLEAAAPEQPIIQEEPLRPEQPAPFQQDPRDQMAPA